MKQEVGDLRAGGHLIAQHIAYTVLVEAIRLNLEGSFANGVGWLFALADTASPRVPFELMRSEGDYSLVELAIRLGLADGRPA